MRNPEVTVTFRNGDNPSLAFRASSLAIEDPYLFGQEAFREAFEAQVFAKAPRFVVIKGYDNDVRLFSPKRISEISRYPLQERDELLDEMSLEAEEAKVVEMMTLIFKR